MSAGASGGAGAGAGAGAGVGGGTGVHTPVCPWQLGHSKVFLRAGVLERLLAIDLDLRESAAHRLQAVTRGRQARKRFEKQRQSAVLLKVRGICLGGWSFDAERPSLEGFPCVAFCRAYFADAPFAATT